MTPPGFGLEFRAQLADLFRWRRDVRRLRPDPVPGAVPAALLDAANLAPSVGLSQPWRCVTVADPTRRAAVHRLFLPPHAAGRERRAGLGAERLGMAAGCGRGGGAALS